MPTCCKGKGRPPAIRIYRSGNAPRGEKRWYAIVGGSMLTGFTNKQELLVAAKAAQAQQRQLLCGHVLRTGAEDNAK